MPLTLAEARARAGDVTDVSYVVELDLTDAASFTSTVTVRFRSRSGRTFLDLDGARDVVVGVGAGGVHVVYEGGRIALGGNRSRSGRRVEIRRVAPLHE